MVYWRYDLSFIWRNVWRLPTVIPGQIMCSNSLMLMMFTLTITLLCRIMNWNLFWSGFRSFILTVLLEFSYVADCALYLIRNSNNNKLCSQQASFKCYFFHQKEEFIKDNEIKESETDCCGAPLIVSNQMKSLSSSVVYNCWSNFFLSILNLVMAIRFQLHNKKINWKTIISFG